MKGRVWIVVCAILIAVLLGGYFTAAHVLRLDRKIRDYLVARVSAELGVSFSVSSISITPWLARLDGLEIRLKGAPLTIRAERVRIGFNFLQFARNGFRPVYGAEQIYLDQPLFIWTLGVSDSLPRGKKPELSLKNFPTLRVNVHNATVQLCRDGETRVFADHIDGWLDGRDRRNAVIKAEARVLSSRTNAVFSGLITRANDSATLKITAKGCDFARPALTLLTGRIVPHSGAMDMSLDIGFQGGKLACKGDFAVDGGSLELTDTRVNVTDMRIRGRVNESEIILDSATGEMWGVNPDLRGSIRFSPKPALDLAFNARGIDLARIFPELLPDLKEFPLGKVDLHARLNGFTDDFTADADISSRAIAFRNRSAENVRVRLRLDPGGVRFDEVSGVFAGLDVKGSGQLRGTYRSGIRTFSATVMVDELRRTDHRYSLRLNGIAGKKSQPWTAEYDLRDDGTADTALRHVSGALSLLNDTLGFTCANTVFSFDGQIADIFSAPRVETRVTLNHTPILKYAGVNDSTFLLDGKGGLTGTLERFTLDGDFTLAYGKSVTAKLNGKAEFLSFLRKNRNIVADAQVTSLRALNSIPVDLALSLRSDSLSTTVFLNDRAGQARMFLRAIHANSQLSGELNLNAYPLESIIRIFDTGDYAHGKITGSAQIGGTIRKPNFITSQPLQVSECNVDVITRLTASGSVSGNPGELKFSGVEVRRDGIPIVFADGIWTRGNPFILSGGGKDIEFGAMRDVISKERKIDGKIDYGVTMRFTKKSGDIDGTFTVRNGHFLDIPFDTASAELGGGSKGFRAVNFQIMKEGVYSGTGSASSGFIWKDATLNPGLNLNLDLKGKLTRAIPYLTTAIRKADGEARLNITLGGSWQEPAIVEGRVTVTGAVAEPTFLVNRVSDINATLVIDPDTRTPSGLKAVRIVSASGMVNNRLLVAENVFEGDERWDAVKKPELLDVVNDICGLDFGVFVGHFDRGKTRDRFIELHVPGFMRPGDTGRLELAEDKGGVFTVGASSYEDHLTPYIAGTIRVLSGDITFPLLVEPNSSPENAVFLEEIFWNMEIYAGSSVYYFNEINKTIGETSRTLPLFNFKIPLAGANIAKTLAKLDEKSTFSVTGRLADSSFRVVGDARSSSGTVSYVGVEFNIEIIELDLDTERVVKPVVLSARAKTSVRDDSTGVDTEIYLKVNAVNTISGQRRMASDRADAPGGNVAEMATELSMMVDAGPLGLLEIQFTSTNPTDNTRERVLARLGLSPGRIGSAATRALAQGMDNYYVSFLRPVEDAIRKYTGLDVVRFTPAMFGNLVRSKLTGLDRFSPDTDYMLMDGSRVMLGEYFLDSFFLSYRGQYGLARDFLRRKERGFYHELSLQYLLERNTRLQFNINYDQVIRKDDKRFEIRHDFGF